jgi:hypothetical protein
MFLFLRIVNLSGEYDPVVSFIVATAVIFLFMFSFAIYYSAVPVTLIKQALLEVLSKRTSSAAVGTAFPLQFWGVFQLLSAP